MSRPLYNQGSMVNTSTIGGGFLQNNWVKILIGVAVVAVIAVVSYYFVYKPNSTPILYSENNEHRTSSTQENKTAEIMFFYADWCPHCKTAKPIWNDLKAEYENKTINGYKVVFTEINCSEETAEVDKMMNQYNVEGYPTIKLLKDGQVIEYDAKPSKETLTQFLNTVL